MFKCYLCGNNSAEVVADKEKVRFNVDCKFLKCLKCDLVQMYPQKEMSYEGYGEKKDFKGSKRKVKISKYLKRYVKRGERAFEVGCGEGDNIKYLLKRGVLACGIDLETGNGYESFALNIKQDFIYAIHLAEHLADPKEFVCWMKENLKPNTERDGYTILDGGKWLLEIPCIDDPLIKLYKNKAYDKFCWYPYHLFFYSGQTIKKLFDGMSVKIIRRQEYGVVNHLRWLFRGKPGNWNPHIPIIDDVYKWVLCRLGYSDSLIVVGNV